MTQEESFSTRIERLQDGTTPGESFGNGMVRLQGIHSVLGWNDSRGVTLFWDETSPGESFCTGMERLQVSPSVLGWNDSRVSFHPRTEQLQGSHSVLRWNNSSGVILSWDRTTPGDSFCPGIERL